MVTRPVTKQDIPNESKFMTEFWNLIKEFYVVPDDYPDGANEYWELLLKRCRQIDKDCNSRLGQILMNGFLQYLEEKWKAGGANANQGG